MGIGNPVRQHIRTVSQMLFSDFSSDENVKGLRIRITCIRWIHGTTGSSVLPMISWHIAVCHYQYVSANANCVVSSTARRRRRNSLRCPRTNASHPTNVSPKICVEGHPAINEFCALLFPIEKLALRACLLAHCEVFSKRAANQLVYQLSNTQKSNALRSSKAQCANILFYSVIPFCIS